MFFNSEIGNASTELTSTQSVGVLQPNGRIAAEATFDPKHVGEAIVHIASLPLDVTVLTFNIMQVPIKHLRTQATHLIIDGDF